MQENTKKRNMNPAIFRKDGIAGKYPSELNKDAVYNISRAFVQFAARFSFLPTVVSYDGRRESRSLADAVFRALRDEGSPMMDAGVTTTSMHDYILSHAEVRGGIMVTTLNRASEYNGIRPSLRYAVELAEFHGLEEIKGIAERYEWRDKTGRSFVQDNYLDEYIMFLSNAAPEISLRLAIDCGNGAASVVLEPLLEKLPQLAATRLNFDPDAGSSKHSLDLSEKNALARLQGAFGGAHCDLGAAFDWDGDRVVFIDEKGEVVPPDLIAALLAKALLERQGSIGARYAGRKVVHDSRISSAAAAAITKAGGELVAAVDDSQPFIKRTMRNVEAIFGGDSRGHYFYPEVDNACMGVLTMLRVMSLMAESGKPLSELIGELN